MMEVAVQISVIGIAIMGYPLGGKNAMHMDLCLTSYKKTSTLGGLKA